MAGREYNGFRQSSSRGFKKHFTPFTAGRAHGCKIDYVDRFLSRGFDWLADRGLEGAL